MLDTIVSSHPITTFVLCDFTLAVTGYVVVSLGIALPHLRRSFSWPVRAIRNARWFV